MIFTKITLGILNHGKSWINVIIVDISFVLSDDEISKATDEVIDEIYTDDEALHPSTSKSVNRIRKSEKSKNYHQIIEKMKKSLIVSNQSGELIGTNILENIDQAKEVITSISNELEYHQKQAL